METEKKETAVALFDVSESVFQAIETYKSLEIVDSKTEKDVRAARADVRDIRYKIQKRHKELNSDLNSKKKEYKTMAESLVDRLLPTETNLDEKIKAVEAVAEKARAEKLASEKIRTDVIKSKFADIARITADAQAYGKTSKQINESLAELHSAIVTDEEFHEFRAEAEKVLDRDIGILTAAFNRAVQFEENQKAQAELEAKNKAEAERLAKIAQEQEKAAAEAKAAQDKADAEAKAKRDAESEKIAADRKAFEDEKAKAAAEEKAIKEYQANLLASMERREQELEWAECAASLTSAWMAEAYAENERINAEREESKAKALKIAQEAYSADYDNAHIFNAQMSLGQSMADDIEAARIEALRPDKEKLIAFAEMIAAIKLPGLNTKEGGRINTLADHRLRQCVTEIMEAVGELK